VFEHDPKPSAAMQAFTELSDLVGHLGGEQMLQRVRFLRQQHGTGGER
jgi:hypothetical protein